METRTARSSLWREDIVKFLYGEVTLVFRGRKRISVERSPFGNFPWREEIFEVSYSENNSYGEKP